MSNFKIRIESVEKNSPDGAIALNQHWNINNIGDARDLITHQRQIHQNKSRWFKIYKNDLLIFDSNFIHH